MKVHFNYNASKEVQLVIESDNFEDLYVSRFYKNDADIIAAFNENNLESEEQEKKQLGIV
jgi:hypothetical protein